MIVFGEGPIGAEVMAIGEAPGRDEDLLGRPFVGRSGQAMDRYWGRGGVPLREDIFITNVIKQWPGPGNRDPLPQEVEYWLPSLCAEIEAVRPRVILTLGRFALRLFCDLDMESAHGIPLDIPTDRVSHPVLREALRRAGHDTSVLVFPSYHPAFALHDPTMQSLLTYDFERLGQALRGLLPARHLDSDARGTYDCIDHMPGTFYSSAIGLDTEGYRRAVWGLSFSDVFGRGRVVRAKHAEKFKQLLEREAYRRVLEADMHGAAENPLIIYLHHALHDLPILRELGIDLLAMNGVEIRDTMVMAYLLGLEPQGLKPLCYRKLGKKMGDYLDLIAISDERIAREWLIQLAVTLPEPGTPKSKMKKAERLAYVEPDPLTADLMRARKLIDAMLLKTTPIRKRWNDGTAREILEDELCVVDEMPLPTLDDVIEDHGGDETAVIEYAGADADGTRGVGPILEKDIDAYGLRDAFETTNGIIPMIDRMQEIGIKVNPDHFHGIIPIFDGRAAELDVQIEKILGHPINANSPIQTADALFTKLKLHKLPAARHIKFKRTQTGNYSTDDKALEALEDLHPIVPLIRGRREMTKLKGSYCLPILKLYDEDDFRLRCELMLTRTDTGRLAAKKPNLLAWPKHSEWGMLIRHGFVADEGHEFGAWDLDQIEMKVFADNANEINMLLAFASGKDLHADTAALIFGRPYAEIMDEYKGKFGKGGEQRFAAKAVNFGILMGITAFGLLAQFHKNGQLHWTLEMCEQLLADWKKAYPNGWAYIQSKHEEARRYGYVRDMFGRLRWLDGVHSEDDYIRAEAERMAQSTPVQSGAQGIMQRAMRNLWPDLVRLRRQFWTEPLLQTHDELLFEYDTRYRDDMHRLVLGHMERAVTLKVPVTAKGSFGLTWAAVS